MTLCMQWSREITSAYKALYVGDANDVPQAPGPLKGAARGDQGT